MRLSRIRLNGLAVVDLPIIDATPQDLYICKSVEGLGPVEVDVAISRTLNAGGVFQGKNPQNKQIVALVGLNPDYSLGQVPADLRTDIYGMMSTPDGSINVQIVNDEDVVAEITGYVGNVEINPFSDKPEVQITINCTSSYFSAPDELFIAPSDKTAVVIDNTGTAPTGFFMGVLFTSNVSDWSITHISGQKMQFDFDFLTGDLLEFDTRPGHRGIWVTRASVRTNIIYVLTSDSTWLMLHGGANNFTTSSSAFDWGDVFYLPLFWGI